MHEEWLRISGVSKTFPGVRALDSVSFDLRKGEVHCLCGENGAGKSTFIKILSGAYQPDEGTIRFDGALQERLTPRLAMELGIHTIYQEHILFNWLSVTENLFVGKENTSYGVVRRKNMRKRAREVLDFLHADISPDAIVGTLGSSAQKTVEIARGMVQDAKVIILDEPTASFGKAEIDGLLALVNSLKERGVGVIYISHHLEEIFKIADRVTVMRDGSKVATYERSEITEEKLIRDMIGRDTSSFYKRRRVPVGDVLFEARNLSGNGLDDISFTIRRGELVGVAGMAGSGRTELADLIFGAKKKTGGEMLIDGKRVRIRNPQDAIRHSMCYITEDRQSRGLFLIHSLARNTTIAQHTKERKLFSTMGEDRRTTMDSINKLRIRASGPTQQAFSLSGGNQQKVILARWFLTEGVLYIFDEPTRGIDIGSKEEIYLLMVDLLSSGNSILMISSDMPELIAMSDRVLVMKDKELKAELPKDKIDEEHILLHSIGGKQI